MTTANVVQRIRCLNAAKLPKLHSTLIAAYFDMNSWCSFSFCFVAYVASASAHS
jgi:hypothetical protein